MGGATKNDEQSALGENFELSLNHFDIHWSDWLDEGKPRLVDTIM